MSTVFRDNLSALSNMVIGGVVENPWSNGPVCLFFKCF
jgi:hypothetical protein